MTVVLEQNIAIAVLEELVAYGVTNFCMAPGGRNAALVALLKREPQLKTTYFNDERCAAFFALGCSRRTGRPTAIVVTSGTAVAHLLPAAMEAYYTSVPLVLVTADRPRRFRGSNAPQSCEQVGIFGQYAPYQLDLADGDPVCLDGWDRRRPLHINICLEEPKNELLAKESLLRPREVIAKKTLFDEQKLTHVSKSLDQFLKSCRSPFVAVSTLKEDSRESVVQFLLKLGAPVYLEGISGLREDPRLQHLAIRVVDKLWKRSKESNYAIDGIIRIGGVPTPRFWRDLEEQEGKMPVFNLSEEPFSGLSWGGIVSVPLKQFFESYEGRIDANFEEWKAKDTLESKRLEQLYQEEPHAEPSLIHALSKIIPVQASLFLGQSLPIRTWDMSASFKLQHSCVQASRGLNGIDGQLSTFLGLCGAGENVALLGDLTALHDLGGWWVLPQLGETPLKLVVVNNGGGKLFTRMFSDQEIQNKHSLCFEPIAKFWNVAYERWEKIPNCLPAELQQIIELCPDEAATNRFWKAFG